MENDLSHLITQDNISQVRHQAERTLKPDEAVSADREIEELNQQSLRIEELIDKIERLPDPGAQMMIHECLQELLSFYGKGLERIMEIACEAGGREKVSELLMQDSFINSLLLIHGLHPLDLQTRMQQALDKVRPYMDSHGGSVEIISLEEGKALLKLNGSCDGCPSSSVTLELAIKEAIEECCPDLEHLEVEGVVPAPTFDGTEARPRTGANGGVSGWTELPGMIRLEKSTMKATEVQGIPLVICRVDDHLFAYKDLCPACELPLNTGRLEGDLLSCRLGHSYELAQAGKCKNDPDIHLSPFPLLIENGLAKVAVF